MKYIKTFNEAMSLEERRKNALFKKELWKFFSKEDQDLFINLKHALSEARSAFNYMKNHRGDATSAMTDIKKYTKQIKQLEQKYYEMYKHLYDVLTNSKLKDLNDKTGIFEGLSKKLKDVNDKTGIFDDSVILQLGQYDVKRTRSLIRKKIKEDLNLNFKNLDNDKLEIDASEIESIEEFEKYLKKFTSSRGKVEIIKK